MMNCYFNSRPHEEVDHCFCAYHWHINISTHDLTRRSTLTIGSCCLAEYISTHDLTRRSTLTPAIESLSVIFQLTTSRGGRPEVGIFDEYIDISTHDLTRRSTVISDMGQWYNIFQLTTSRGGRLHQRQLPQSYFYFNSRPHEEVDRYSGCTITDNENFNSRPHEEVDDWRLMLLFRIIISTHDLTRRSTAISYNTTSFKIVFFVLILYF